MPLHKRGPHCGEKVFPSVVKAYPYPKFKKVVVQQDGASPHTGKDVVARLNAIGAELSPKLEVRTQPAQSPDMNVNDLALFRALDVLVRKMRRGEGNAFDKEKLVGDVLKAYAEYSSEQLEAMLLTCRLRTLACPCIITGTPEVAF